MRAIIASLLVLAAWCGAAFPCRADEARSVVILDATAQMSAMFSQKRKIDWAKAAISASASRMAPESAFAVWAFGISPEKKCEDISELVPLQPAGGSQQKLNKALGAVQPKAARSPAMDTLQAALKSPGLADGKPVSVTLVAGTGDDCGGDICKAAGRLHALYPNARFSVLGLNMNEQAAANFTCAAKAMGGAFTGVKSGGDLERNLRDALGIGGTASQPKTAAAVEPAPVASGSQGATEPPAAAPAIAPEAAPANEPSSPTADQPADKQADEKAAQPPQPEPNAILSAALAPGMPPLETGVTWEIYKIQVTPTGQLKPAETPLWVGGGGQARAKLPEGRYSVKLAYGLATGGGDFTVDSGKTEKTFALDAGSIVAEALQTPNGPPVGDAFFVVSRQKTPAAREELSRSSGTPALFQLNAGDYLLSAFADGAKQEASVKVIAGKVSVVRVSLNVGALEIKTFAKDGASEPVAAWHRLSLADPDGKSGATPVLISSGASLKLDLPAGTYRLETVYGNARDETTVTVKAGELTSKTVILNSGEAKISLPQGKTGRVCAVFEAGADRKAGPVARAAGSDIRLILKAGLYNVECAGKDNAAMKQTEIRVVAGEVQSAKIDD